MEPNRFAVYPPAAEGFPYLAAMMFPNGQITVAPYPTEEEAILHNQRAEIALERIVKPDAHWAQGTAPPG
jgi:hypothetical protein